MSDLQKAVAVVFRKRGGGALTGTDFRHVASFDLKWFPPREAARLLDAALAAGLLVDDGTRLRPSFDLARVEVPIDFRPGPEVLEAPPAPAPPPAAPAPPARAPAAPAPPAPTLLDVLAEACRVAPEELAAQARLERERAERLIGEDTALLLAARRRGADVRPHLRQ